MRRAQVKRGLETAARTYQDQTVAGLMYGDRAGADPVGRRRLYRCHRPGSKMWGRGEPLTMSPTTLAPARKRQQILSRLNLHPQQGRFVPLAVFLVALLVRLGPLLWNSGLRFDSGQYDDGVYFAAAQHLVLGGQVPYRDFVL